MMVRNGASTWQVPRGTPAPIFAIRRSLGQMARECAVLGDTMTIKVGVEGRVLVGPEGRAGSLAVPLRIALVQEGPQPKSIWTKFYSVPVNVPQGQTAITFTHVEDDLTFAIPPSKNLSSLRDLCRLRSAGCRDRRQDRKKKTEPSEKAAAKPSPSRRRSLRRPDRNR